MNEMPIEVLRVFVRLHNGKVWMNNNYWWHATVGKRHAVLITERAALEYLYANLTSSNGEAPEASLP